MKNLEVREINLKTFPLSEHVTQLTTPHNTIKKISNIGFGSEINF